ncbi:MAG: hypothetical protein IPP17_11585 [Bacteroidetes bacterium]|nr:hypothetical protein [Bacteroidota bacterium]
MRVSIRSLKIRRPHLGTDYAAEVGTPINRLEMAWSCKPLSTAGMATSWKIKHNGTYTTKYLHILKFGAGIKAVARCDARPSDRVCW